MAILINRWDKGFNRMWLVFCLFPSFFFRLAESDVVFGVKTFLVCFAVGHIGFVAVSWIVQGFR